MSNFTSPCLAALESDTTVQGLIRLFVCPYSEALTFPEISESISGEDLFYTIISVGVLAMIYQRTQSFGFTAIVALVCGTAMLALFPLQLQKVGIGLISLALAGVLLRMFKDKD